MLTINTNVNNLKLQRQLNSVSARVQLAFERMSTGYRINSASDDAAGLMISKGLSVQESGLTIANNNIQMATSILNTASGALSNMSDLVLRIRDLALQSANGGYSTSERTAMQMEVDALTSNISQLLSGTKFNNYYIFKGESASPATASIPATASATPAVASLMATTASTSAPMPLSLEEPVTSSTNSIEESSNPPPQRI